jgi:hypothetical protein
LRADEDGLARLVLKLGIDVRACVEMMSGAVWVHDQLAAAGWQVQVAHARKVRDVAPLACKTDKGRCAGACRALPARLGALTSGCRPLRSGRCASNCGGGCTSSGCARRR